MTWGVRWGIELKKKLSLQIFNAWRWHALKCVLLKGFKMSLSVLTTTGTPCFSESSTWHITATVSRGYSGTGGQVSTLRKYLQLLFECGVTNVLRNSRALFFFSSAPVKMLFCHHMSTIWVEDQICIIPVLVLLSWWSNQRGAGDFDPIHCEAG